MHSCKRKGSYLYALMLKKLIFYALMLKIAHICMHSFKTLHLVTRFWMCIQCERYSIRSLNVLLLFQCTISVYMQRLNILSESNVYFSAVLLEMYKNRKPKWGRCLKWAAGAVVRWCMGQSHAGSRRVNISSDVCMQWNIWQQPALVKDFEGELASFLLFSRSVDWKLWLTPVSR